MLQNKQETSPSQAATFGKSTNPSMDRNNATDGHNAPDAHINANGCDAPDRHKAPHANQTTDTNNEPENIPEFTGSLLDINQTFLHDHKQT